MAKRKDIPVSNLDGKEASQYKIVNDQNLAKRRRAKAQSSKGPIIDRPKKIYRVAAALFLERGYDNTPLSLIARELGLSKAGLYHHYESKEQLLFQIHKSAIEGTLVPVIERAESEPDPVVRLEVYIREYAEVMARDPEIRVLIEESKRLSPENLETIRDTWRRGFQIMRQTIEELQSKGICKPGLDPTITAFAAIGMCSWVPYWLDHDRPEMIGDIGKNFAEIFCSGALGSAAPVSTPENIDKVEDE